MKKTLTATAKIAAGTFLVAFGICAFLLPAKISTGGVGTISTVLFYRFGLSVSALSFGINGLLFVLAIKILPREELWKNPVGIALLSLWLKALEPIPSFCRESLLSALFGGALVGLGVGIACLAGGSTGGSDFAVVILKKIFPRLPFSATVLILDGIIILAGGVLLGDGDLIFLSLVSLYVSNRVMDTVLVRGSFSKSVIIVSEHASSIAEKIAAGLSRGVTELYARGFYEKKEKKILLCVVKNREVARLLKTVQSCDSAAFTVVTDARYVRGKGF